MNGWFTQTNHLDESFFLGGMGSIRVSLCNSGLPRSCYVEQADLKLTEILMVLPKCWD